MKNSTSKLVCAVMLSVATGTTAAFSKDAPAGKATGKATIYSDKFNGKSTATGSKFDNHEVSAASNKLPLGSKAVVKNKKTGKSVVVKINDRMSKKSSAVVDLSKGAAQKIGVNGTGQVDAHVVSSPKK